MTFSECPFCTSVGRNGVLILLEREEDRPAQERRERQEHYFFTYA
jgi:hypothetical protein